ncbi:MAG TPA: hypothetical protein PKY58_07755 [Syntrophales bacterium]|nr:hypothetical protein [Syntrophales bacterium]HPX11694.1 hypothetical protein [Syntrophales bacterium]HQB31420.1 hypothetical protein [Syntrophales bacterium]HQN78520.1 hypothetical protein [Syntrophales bacterium]HQQ27406.1 hypothetical protein [Syntrophales bacterium]
MSVIPQVQDSRVFSVLKIDDRWYASSYSGASMAEIQDDGTLGSWFRANANLDVSEQYVNQRPVTNDTGTSSGCSSSAVYTVTYDPDLHGWEDITRDEYGRLSGKHSRCYACSCQSTPRWSSLSLWTGSAAEEAEVAAIEETAAAGSEETLPSDACACNGSSSTTDDTGGTEAFDSREETVMATASGSTAESDADLSYVGDVISRQLAALKSTAAYMQAVRNASTDVNSVIDLFDGDTA